VESSWAGLDSEDDASFSISTVNMNKMVNMSSVEAKSEDKCAWMGGCSVA